MTNIARLLVERGAVAFRTSPPFTFTSGVKSPVYVDNRRLLTFVNERERVVQEFERVMSTRNQPPADVIAGTATAGIPWAAWLSQALRLPMVYVRGKPKAWGQSRSVEGLAIPGRRVVVVEDLVFTAGSLVTSIRNLREHGFVVERALSIVTYAIPHAHKALEDLDINLSYLTTIDETLTAAVGAGLLDKNQQALVKSWLDERREEIGTLQDSS